MRNGFLYLAAIVLMALAGCGSEDSTDVEATADTASPNSEAETVASFTLTSTSFDSGGAIPEEFACEDEGGNDISPQLSWSDPPVGTSSYAIVMDDEIAPCGSGDDACMHWSVFNIPADVTALGEGEDPTEHAGVTLGRNYTGGDGYAGPCPPEAHLYKITVFALADGAPLIQTGDAVTRSRFESRNAEFILGSDTIQGTFTP
jgi:hypothetical protein